MKLPARIEAGLNPGALWVRQWNLAGQVVANVPLGPVTGRADMARAMEEAIRVHGALRAYVGPQAIYDGDTGNLLMVQPRYDDPENHEGRGPGVGDG